MIPPWASTWVTDHWFMSTVIALFSIMGVLGTLRVIVVNFFKIFHRRSITVNINTQGTSATPEQLGTVVRNQVQEQLENVGWRRPRRSQESARTRLQSIDDD